MEQYGREAPIGATIRASGMDELSIIIPTLNEQRYIPHLLTSIAKQKFDGKLQIIVVDGRSTGTTQYQVEQSI